MYAVVHARGMGDEPFLCGARLGARGAATIRGDRASAQAKHGDDSRQRGAHSFALARRGGETRGAMCANAAARATRPPYIVRKSDLRRRKNFLHPKNFTARFPARPRIFSGPAVARFWACPR
jgi:hypothetical protein